MSHCVPFASRFEYALRVQPGAAPAWLERASALPLQDVQASITALTTGLDGVWREPSGREIEIPHAHQVQGALRALRSCGYQRQADEIAAHLKAALGRVDEFDQA